MSRIPDKNVPLTLSGFLTSSSRLFLDNLQRIMDRDIEVAYRLERYSNLASLTAYYPNPKANMLVMITGQGQAVYKESIDKWVLSSDDTTLIV